MESDQRQSTLFTLPPEVRNEIYRFCIPILEMSYWHGHGYIAPPSRKNRYYSLVLACKKLYREADPILREEMNVIFVHDIRGHATIVSRGVGPFNLRRVRHLQLHVQTISEEIYCALADFLRRYKTDLKELCTLHFHFTKERSPFENSRGQFIFDMSRTLLHQSLRFFLSPGGECHGNLTTLTLRGHYSRTLMQRLEGTIKDLRPDVAVVGLPDTRLK